MFYIFLIPIRNRTRFKRSDGNVQKFQNKIYILVTEKVTHNFLNRHAVGNVQQKRIIYIKAVIKEYKHKLYISINYIRN